METIYINTYDDFNDYLFSLDNTKSMNFIYNIIDNTDKNITLIVLSDVKTGSMTLSNLLVGCKKTRYIYMV